ncbi:MAG: SEC-C metal-binding domain-containing protein, partial [Alkalispirochaeta sp.]
MAGRGTDIKLGGNPEFRARRALPEDHTPDQLLAEIEKERTRWRADYDEVRELGGLYVLGTERHESRRIDNQLRGRSGRQGDPGESRFFLSMDDDLMRLFGGGRFNLKGIMERGLEPGEPLNHSLINKSIERAQNKVEERNFDIRKHLLEFDDVVNEQRKVIYEQRDAIMADDRLVARVLATAEDVIAEVLESTEVGRTFSEAQLQQFFDRLQDQLLYYPPRDVSSYIELSPEQLSQSILKEMDTEMQRKREIVGPERFNFIIRIEYLRTIDQRWQDHLENLEELREAVYLRGYAQRNPLLEYKLEGFRMFDELLAGIRVSIAKRMFAIKAQGMEERKPAAATAGTAQHRDMSLLGAGSASGSSPGAAAAASGAQGSTPRQAQIKRTVPKVGRNDPCPCGSGKKYKHCHGRNA